MISWILSLLNWVASVLEQLGGVHFVRDLRSFEPRAWLMLMTILLAVAAVTSFVRSTRVRMASARRHYRRFDSVCDRVDGE